jgi:hypothetical protein
MKLEARLACSAGVATLFALLGGGAAAPAGAQTPLPAGPQALANVTTTGNQDESAVAVDPNGNFVVVWRDEFLDGNASAIVGRRFQARTGLPLSGEFLINFSPTGDQRNPAIAIASDGHFVVVWEGPDNINPPITPGIFGRLFAADGTPITSSDFAVNNDHAGLQRRPAVAMQPNGAFAVVWQDDTPPNFTLGGTGDNIRGRFYPANFPSAPPSAPLFLNLGFDGDQEEPAVAALPGSGLWIVGWQGPRQLSPAIPMILVRVVDASASGTGEFEMNTSGTAVQRAHVALAANGQGDAVAVWEAPDDAFRGIFARRIVDGVPSGNEEAINLSTAMDEREPSVAIDGSGSFVTVWVAGMPVDPPFDASPEGSPIIIQGRKKSGSGFAEAGDLLVPPADGEFQISSSGTGFLDPWVASEPRGNFVVAWQGVDTVDPQGNAVLYRGFRDALFADDFETSDTNRWSTTVP